MTELVLFSLDVLINMPRLYANALDKAFDGRVSHEEILERLADGHNDVLGIIHEAYSEKHDKEKPVNIGSILAQKGYTDGSLQAYKKFIDALSTGSHHCVKDKTRELLRELQHVHTGIFYPMKESIVRRIVNNAKLDHAGIDIIAGYDPEVEIEDVVRKAIAHIHSDRTLLVAKDGKRAPEYELVAQMVNAEYVPCNEISEAPIEPVRRALGL
jgi:hypothetical protein